MALSDLKPENDPERDLVAIIDDEIAASICFDNDEVESANGSKTDNSKGDRETALEYYNGKMWDLPHEDGWSSAVSRDVAETVDQTMPGLMRVFAGSDNIVKYQPARPGEEPQAEQATDYVNHVFWVECSGYLVLFTSIMDASQVRNGVLKAYWDKTPEIETEDLTGLDEEQVMMLLDDPSVEVVAHSQSVQLMPDQMSGQMQPVPVYDLRIKRTESNGRLVVECVSPENFGVSTDAKNQIDKGRMVWERTFPTRSDLVKEGYDKADVDAIPAYVPTPRTDDMRGQDIFAASASSRNRAMDVLEVYECYVLTDFDDDGIAERRKVVVAGPAGSRKILANDPWSEDVPYEDVKVRIVPHRWQGKSIGDSVADVQRIKTAILRQLLNNLYGVNNPQKAADISKFEDPDELLSPSIGGVYRLKPNTDAQAAVQWSEVPYIGDKALAAMQAFDAVITKRTGISQATPALDQTALDPQTATAEQLEHDANYASTELTARTISFGLQNFFRKVLRVIVRNQDRPRTIQLRGKWVDFDPRDWNANMTCSVQIGHGTGSRERDLNMLGGVSKLQDQVIATLGPNNPIVTPEQKVKTYQAMTEAAGLRDPDQFFTSVSNEQFQQWQQSQPPKADPEMAKAQAKIQGDQAKVQGQLQLTAAKHQGDAQAAQVKAQNDLDIAKAKLAQDFMIKMKELELEAELKSQQMAMQVHAANETQVAQPK